MEYSERQVENMACGPNHIFFTRESLFADGLFIVFIHLPDKTDGRLLWEAFLDKYPEPIYFSTRDPSYIGNHCKFHGKYGGKKVYQYVRS